MTSDRLLHALGEIDPELIEEAMPHTQTVSKRRLWKRYGSLAAGLLLFCLVGVSVIGMPGADSAGQADPAGAPEYVKDLNSDYVAPENSTGGNLPGGTQIIRPTPQQGTITNVVLGDNVSDPMVININSVEGKLKPANAFVNYTASTITSAEQDMFTQATGIAFGSLAADVEAVGQLYDLMEIYKQSETKTEEPPASASDYAAVNDLANGERKELPTAYEVILNSYGVPAYLYISTEDLAADDWEFTKESDLSSDINGVDVRFYSFADAWVAMFENCDLDYYLEVHDLDIVKVVSLVEALLY